MLKYADALPVTQKEPEIKAPLGANGKPLDLSRIHPDLRASVKDQKSYDIARRYNPTTDAPKKPEPPQYNPTGPYPGYGAQNAYDRFNNPGNYDEKGNAKYDVGPGAYRAADHPTQENLEIARIQNQALREAIHDRALAFGQGVWNGTDTVVQGTGALLRGTGNIVSKANKAMWWPTAKAVEKVTGYDSDKFLDKIDYGHKLYDKGIAAAQDWTGRMNGVVQDNYDYYGNRDDHRDMFIAGTAVPVVMATAYGARVPGAGRLVAPFKATNPTISAAAGRAANAVANAGFKGSKALSLIPRYYSWLSSGSTGARATAMGANAVAMGLPAMDLATGATHNSPVTKGVFTGLTGLAALANPASLGSYAYTHSEGMREPLMEAAGHIAANNARMVADQQQGVVGNVARSTADAIKEKAPGLARKGLEWLIEPSDVQWDEVKHIGANALRGADMGDLLDENYTKVTRDALDKAPSNIWTRAGGVHEFFTNPIYRGLSGVSVKDMKDPFMRGLYNATHLSDAASDYVLGAANKKLYNESRDLYNQLNDIKQYADPSQIDARTTELLRARIPDMAAAFLGEQYRDTASDALEAAIKSKNSLWNKWKNMDDLQKKYILWGADNGRRALTNWYMARKAVPVAPPAPPVPPVAPTAPQQQIQPQN